MSGEVIAELEQSEPESVGPAAWSTDNRFFLYAPAGWGSPPPAKLVFYDTTTNTTTMVPTAEDLDDIRVR